MKVYGKGKEILVIHNATNGAEPLKIAVFLSFYGPELKFVPSWRHRLVILLIRSL